MDVMVYEKLAHFKEQDMYIFYYIKRKLQINYIFNSKVNLYKTK